MTDIIFYIVLALLIYFIIRDNKRTKDISSHESHIRFLLGKKDQFETTNDHLRNLLTDIFRSYWKATDQDPNKMLQDINMQTNRTKQMLLYYKIFRELDQNIVVYNSREDIES
jgi:hypothetical protein